MRHLALYACAIRNHSSAPVIESCTIDTRAWQEVGFEVVQETATYRFLDGTVVRRTTEKDSLPVDARVCQECWITYEVAQHGSPVESISPERITFNSACRESFWLAYHLTDDGIEKLRGAASSRDSA